MFVSGRAILRSMGPTAFDFAAALRAGDPRIAPTADLDLAAQTLRAYASADAAQVEARARMLELIARRPLDAHRRSSLDGHLTASALVVDARRERALLTHHRKLGRWLQLGGHCDGDANLAHVALREAIEESGIADLAVLPTPIDLDIHPIPARPGEPEHLHYDTRFVVLAPPGARFAVGDESHDLAWVAPEELDALTTDASVRRLFERVFGARYDAERGNR